MEDTRSISPSSSASSHEDHDSDLPEVRPYPSAFTPLWFPFTPVRPLPMFPSMAFPQPLRSGTPVVRHNFKSIEDLLSPLPNSLTSTPSQRNGKASAQNSLFQLPSDDTGYSSQFLSGSLLSLRQSRESIDSQEHEEELENIKPTCASSPIPTDTKCPQESKSAKSKKIRTAFSDHQKLSLDRFYASNRYPDPTQMETLSRLLSLEEKVIRVWFQNKRSREKNHPRMQVPSSQSADPTAAMAFWQQITSSSASHFPH